MWASRIVLQNLYLLLMKWCWTNYAKIYIKITTAKVAKDKLLRKHFRKKQWISEETLDLIDERRNMKAHGKNVNNPEYKEKSHAIRRACRKDKERYTEDKCATILELCQCKHGRTSEMYKKIRTLIKKFTPKLDVIKDAKGETLTENDDILARWKEHCEGLLLRNMATRVPIQQTVMTMIRANQARQRMRMTKNSSL